MTVDDRLSRIDTMWSVVQRAHADQTMEVRRAQKQLLDRYGGAIRRYLVGSLRAQPRRHSSRHKTAEHHGRQIWRDSSRRLGASQSALRRRTNRSGRIAARSRFARRNFTDPARQQVIFSEGISRTFEATAGQSGDRRRRNNGLARSGCRILALAGVGPRRFAKSGRISAVALPSHTARSNGQFRTALRVDSDADTTLSVGANIA